MSVAPSTPAYRKIDIFPKERVPCFLEGNYLPLFLTEHEIRSCWKPYRPKRRRVFTPSWLRNKDYRDVLYFERPDEPPVWLCWLACKYGWIQLTGVATNEQILFFEEGQPKSQPTLRSAGVWDWALQRHRTLFAPLDEILPYIKPKYSVETVWDRLVIQG